MPHFRKYRHPLSFNINTNGVINKTGDGTYVLGDTNASGLTFTNAGALNVNTGTLTLSGTGVDNGTLAIASSSTLDLVGGSRTIDASNLSGTGDLTITSTQFTLNGPTGSTTTLDPKITLNNGGSLSTSGNLALSAPFVQANGTLGGAGSIDLLASGNAWQDGTWSVRLKFLAVLSLVFLVLPAKSGMAAH